MAHKTPEDPCAISHLHIYEERQCGLESSNIKANKLKTLSTFPYKSFSDSLVEHSNKFLIVNRGPCHAGIDSYV